MALARLFAVWLLGKACSSTAAARSWLQRQQHLPLRPEDTKVGGRLGARLRAGAEHGLLPPAGAAATWPGAQPAGRPAAAGAAGSEARLAPLPPAAQELQRELDELDAARLAGSRPAAQHHAARAAFGAPALAAAGAQQPSRLSAAAGPGQHASGPPQSAFMTMTGSMEEIWDEAVQQQQNHFQQQQGPAQQRHGSLGSGSSSAAAGAPGSGPSWGLPGLADTVRGWAGSAAGAVQQAVARLSGSGASAPASSASAGALEGSRAGADTTAVLIGAGVAVVVAYSIYAERQNIRRGMRKGATSVRRGLGEVMGMALGLSPSPMAAVPNARHLQ